MSKVRLYCLGLIVAAPLFIVSPVHAWQLPIEVAAYNDHGEKVYNKLVAGVEPGATDTFDNLWDAPALSAPADLEGSPLLRAYFPATDPLWPDPLWKDVRGTEKGNITWDIVVDSVPSGKSVALSWDVQKVLLKPGEQLALKDNDRIGADGQPVQISVSQASGYTFISDGQGTRSLSLVLSGASGNNIGSGSGSGFGCGTVRRHDDRNPYSGSDVIGVMILFTPLVFLRLLRLFGGPATLKGWSDRQS